MPVALDRVVFSSREYRQTDPATSASASARDKLAGILTFQSLLLQESDANALRDNVLAMRTPGRSTYSVQVLRRKNTANVGDTITLTTDSLSIGTGEFLVKRLRRDFSSLFDTMYLYGPK